MYIHKLQDTSLLLCPCLCLHFFGYSETMSMEQRLLSIPELSHHLAESYLTCCLYLQEMLQYKRQNQGKVQNSYQSIRNETKMYFFVLP